MKIIKRLLYIFTPTIFLCFTQNAWALRCLEGSKKVGFDITTAPNSSHTTVGQEIRITNFNQTADTLLWQSPTYSTRFTCYDDQHKNADEDAYLYLDPNKTLGNLFDNTNVTIGVRYQGRDYEIKKNSSTGNAGFIEIPTTMKALRRQSDTGTAWGQAANNCKDIGVYVLTRRCADPQTININYSIFIKSKGVGNKIRADIGSHDIFQLDGIGGLNASGNFREKVSGISIRYVECVPALNVQNIHLGQYYINDEVNKVLRKVPFNITVNMQGNDCGKYPFVGVLKPLNPVNDVTFTVNEAQLKNVIGLQIFEKNSTTALKLNENLDFGYSQGTALTKQLEAGVLFLKKPTEANTGNFTGVLNYEVYFK